MSDGKTHLEIDAGNETLTIYDEHVTIERGGIVAASSLVTESGEKEIPIEEIKSVKQSRAKVFINQKGHSPNPVIQDMNSIYMGSREEAENVAEQIRATVHERQNDPDKNSDSNTTDTAMETLRQRFAKGEISEDEFQNKRQSLEESR